MRSLGLEIEKNTQLNEKNKVLQGEVQELLAQYQASLKTIDTQGLEVFAIAEKLTEFRDLQEAVQNERLVKKTQHIAAEQEQLAVMIRHNETSTKNYNSIIDQLKNI